MSEPAWEEAGRILGKRPRTEAELREALRARGHGVEAIEQTVERLRARGWLDDRRLAFDFVVARGAERGYGRERVVAELERRGVALAIAEGAWSEALATGAIDADRDLRRQLERRLARHSRIDERAVRSVYNALLRAGYDESAIRRLLEPHLDRSCRGVGDPHDELP